MAFGAPATARASDVAGYSTVPQDYLAIRGSAPFVDMQNAQSGAPWKQARFLVPWDTAATQSASNDNTCVPDTTASTGLTQFLEAMYDAEHVDAMGPPVIAITKDAYDAYGTVVNPTNGAYQCALNALIDDLYNPASVGVNVPDSIPTSQLIVEGYNEPDLANIGNACAPTVADHSPYCAANYSIDANIVLQASSYTPHYTVIYGSFSNAQAANTASQSTCAVNATSTSGFDYCYLYDLNRYFGASPTNWSFHDYIDVQNSWDCGSVAGANCSTTDLTNFDNLLSSFSITSPTTWITEAGIQLTGSYAGYNAGSNNELDGAASSYELHQANAAEGWLTLFFNSHVQHLFYYELQTFGNGSATGSGSDTFDSALIGIDAPDYTAENGGGGNLAPDPGDPSFGETGNAVPRASFCVLAFNEMPATAVSDSRCDYAGSGSELPWTAWQGGEP